MTTTDATTDISTQKTVGVVKWFNSQGGFGFITVLPDEPMAGTDIFVHYSSLNVTDTQYKYLVLGEYVEFILAPSDNEKYQYSAKEVTGIRGGLLICERRRLSALEAGVADGAAGELPPRRARSPQTAPPRRRATPHPLYHETEDVRFVRKRGGGPARGRP